MSGRDPFDFTEPARDVDPAGQAGPAPRTPPAPPDAVTPPAPPAHSAPFGRLSGWEHRGAARPPVVWLFAALAVAAGAALGALLLGADPGVAFLCWVLAGPATIGLISVFVMRDTHARSLPLYIRPPWIGALYVVTAVAVVVGIGASAWRIADWWGRL